LIKEIIVSELINNTEERKKLLKHLILQLHKGEAPEQVRSRLIDVLHKIPYNDVVQVEQELIKEGLPETEILKLCDIHTQVLDGHIDQGGAKQIPDGHPVDTFKKENRELVFVVEGLQALYNKATTLQAADVPAYLLEIKSAFNRLMDVDKHYRRKEYLLFPYLERYNITGPPKVMWGKHDEARELLHAALEAAGVGENITVEELTAVIELVFKPASQAVVDMTMKEEEILLPMSMDTLNDSDWYEIYKQTPEIGFCLYDPQVEWQPAGVSDKAETQVEGNKIQLPSGSFTVAELTAVLNSLPVDLTFVDKHDKVAYFSQGTHRIFDRNRSILQRDVKMCHPPASVHIVEKILQDFKSGRQTSAAFWIQMGGKFIHIEYFAVRDDQGGYLGTLEVSQDLTEKRKLEGDRRLLTYDKD